MIVAISGREWTFDPDRSDDGVLVDRIDADMPEYRAGKTYSLDFVFFQNTQDSTDTGHIDRYRDVREYTRWAGRYVITDAIDGTPRISEHTPSNANVDSIIVKLEPGSEVDATPGLWVALDDVDDQTRYVQDTARIGIRLTVLARGDQYADRQALKDDIGSDL